MFFFQIYLPNLLSYYFIMIQTCTSKPSFENILYKWTRLLQLISIGTLILKDIAFFLHLLNRSIVYFSDFPAARLLWSRLWQTVMRWVHLAILRKRCHEKKITASKRMLHTESTNSLQFLVTMVTRILSFTVTIGTIVTPWLNRPIV